MIKNYIEENKEELLELLRELCRIPAPSHFEHKRAEFCKNWLESKGAKGVYIDEALNVIFPFECDGKNDITVVVAHTDTVFPDMEPMEYKEDDERIYCPGVGDDTASLAVLLMTAKYFIEKDLHSDRGILFVCNSCEEGLGDLKGTKQLMKDFQGRVGRFVSFDGSNLTTINSVCVGSHRYEVEVATEGGHSFQAFGNKNAINEIAGIISDIYSVKVPQKEGSKTTYNVGIIEGGTSVNTIAQNAKILCEYRSDNKESLEYMKNEFEKIFKKAEADDVKITVKMIGDRPCRGNVDEKQDALLLDALKSVIKDVTGAEATFRLASTDCNIPLSMGIAAACIGVFVGSGAHTREEYVEKASLPSGLEIAIKTLGALA